jgi:hypothetical protein
MWAIRSRAQAERAAEGVSGAAVGLAFLFGFAAFAEMGMSRRGAGPGALTWGTHLAIAAAGALVAFFAARPRSLWLATAVLAMAVGTAVYVVAHGYGKALGFLALILPAAVQGWRGVVALRDPELPLFRDRARRS